MTTDALWRRVATGVFSMQPTASLAAGVGAQEHRQQSMVSRVVNGLFSVQPAMAAVGPPVATASDEAEFSNLESLGDKVVPEQAPFGGEVIDFGAFAARRRSAESIPQGEATLAAADEELWQPHVTPVEDLGLVLTRVLTERDETLFALEAEPGGAAGVGDVVYVRFRDERRRRYRDILVPLLRDDSGFVVGDVVVPGNHVLTAIEPLAVLTVADIPTQLAGAVSDSVRLSSVTGRNAWRQLVGKLPGDHRIRAAVETMLQ
ncbi:hypothetical protein [Mycobacterium colombiense]|uniref:hypothetical protein n=1 Tax=Mycobacterium colombiense TaxID=339268 RepID=UPI0011158475|nr:hypothetical protein [Mycobacterium colombiense]